MNTDSSITYPDGTPRTRVSIITVPPHKSHSLTFNISHYCQSLPIVIDTTPMAFDRPGPFNIAYNKPLTFNMKISETNRDSITLTRVDSVNNNIPIIEGWHTPILFRIYSYEGNEAPFYCFDSKQYVYHGVIDEIVPYMTHILLFMPDVIAIRDESCKGCYHIKSLILPDHITHLHTGCFWDCTNLKHVLLPRKLVHIGKGAFAQCQSLTVIFIPSSVKCISDFAFESCINLQVVVFEEDIQFKYEREVVKDAFYHCYKLFGPSINHKRSSLNSFAMYRTLIMRYIHLPLHKVCANPHATIQTFEDCLRDNPKVDGSEMDSFNRHTALHILLLRHLPNDHDLIMQCFLLHPKSLLEADTSGLTPWHIIELSGDFQLIRNFISSISWLRI